MNLLHLPVGILVGAALAALVGYLSAASVPLALAVACVPAFCALAVRDAGLIVAATLPSAYLTYRLGPPNLDMSVADFTLILAIVVALASATAFGRTLSGLLRVVAAYQVLMIAVLIANPTTTAITEWIHRAGLMAGGVLVGAAIVRHDKVQLAIRLLLLTSAAFAGAAVADSLRQGLAPAYPFSVHKNAAGSLLAMVIAFIATAPEGSGVPERYRRHLYVLLGAGLFATRSRGAIVGLAAVFLIWAIRRGGTRRLRAVAFLTAIVGGVFVWNSVQTELRTDVYRTGAISIRERQQDQAWQAFETNTFRGAGIRYYDVDPSLAPEGRPSSTIYEALAESGYVGAAGLALIVIGPLRVLRRGETPWAVVGIAVFGVKAVHGAFDNFWVAGPFTLPWLVLGIVAAFELQREREEAEAPDAAEAPDEQAPAVAAR